MKTEMNFATRLIKYDFSSVDELITEFNKLTKEEVIDLLNVTIVTQKTPIITVKENGNVKYQYACMYNIYEIPEYLKSHTCVVKIVGNEHCNVLHGENPDSGDQLTLDDINCKIRVNLLRLFTNNMDYNRYHIYLKDIPLKSIEYKQVYFGRIAFSNNEPNGLRLRNSNKLNNLLLSPFQPIPNIVNIIQKTYDCKVSNDHLVFSNEDFNRSSSHVIDFKEIRHSRTYCLTYYNTIYLCKLDPSSYKNKNGTFASLMNSVRTFIKVIKYQDTPIESNILPMINLTNDLQHIVLLRHQPSLPYNILVVKKIKFMVNGVFIKEYEFSVSQMITEYQALLPIIHEMIYKYDDVIFDIEFYDLPVKLYTDFIILKYGIENRYINYKIEKNTITYYFGDQCDTIEM